MIENTVIVVECDHCDNQVETETEELLAGARLSAVEAYTRYEIAINDKSNRFANRIEIEELIERAIRLEGLGIGADAEVITMNVIVVPVDAEVLNDPVVIQDDGSGNQITASGRVPPTRDRTGRE